MGRSMTVDYSIFAQDDEDAKQRALQNADNDPLPYIPNSLLSSAEIHDYVRLTGMLSPFYEGSLKSASYEAHIGGKSIWWDEIGVRHERDIARGDPFLLKANSITFVQPEPIFRLPNYIAIRFNLRITHVHRGLLLGTGPLVDPGFEGKLLIPLHNLTSSDYHIDTNEALIWVEFTKTSYEVTPTDEIASKERHFHPFPESKKYLTPENYLQKANRGMPIRSSIPEAIEEGRQSAVAAAASVKQLRNWLTGLGLAAFAALAIGLVTVYVQMGSMVQSSNSLSTSVEQSFAPLVTDTKAISKRTGLLEADIDSLTSKLERIEGKVSMAAEREAVAVMLSTMESRIEEMAQNLSALSTRLEDLSARIAAPVERKSEDQ